MDEVINSWSAALALTEIMAFINDIYLGSLLSHVSGKY